MAGHIATAKSQNWTTDADTVARIKRVFGGRIDLDPCSNSESVVGALRNYSLPDKNGLKEPWDAEYTYFNPPFGRAYIHGSCNSLCIKIEVENRGKGKKKKRTVYTCTRCQLVLEREHVEGSSITDWLQRGAQTSREDYSRGVIGLIPAAVSTRHFHKYVWEAADAVCFPKGRLKFDGLPAEDARENDNGGSAPMDTVLAYWGQDADAFENVFNEIGYVDRLDLQRLAKNSRISQEDYDSLKELETMPSVGDLQSPPAQAAA